ncbi:MAG: hypothetical protein AB1774_08110 [Bacillota bacterium]
MNKRTSYVGVFLVLGAAVGAGIFALTNQPWHIGAGAGVGIVVGA